MTGYGAGVYGGGVYGGGSVNLLAVTYDDTLSRVQVNASGLSATAVTAVVDRSLDGIAWTTVRGGSAVQVSSGALALPLDDYEFPADVAITYRVRTYDSAGALLDTVTASITVNLQFVWLKFVSAPYLNRKVTLVGWGPIGRRSRTGVFQVSARREPVIVTDLHTTREVTVSLYTTDNAETLQLDSALSLGQPLFLHVPTSCTLPTMYAAIGDYSYDKPAARSVRGRFTVPLTEAGAPASAVVGSAGTWQTLLTDYATWNDVLTDNPTWLQVATLIGSPTDIIVAA